jgi:hypothetical protein
MIVGALFVLSGQALMMFMELGWVTTEELLALTYIVFIWLVLGALAIFFSRNQLKISPPIVGKRTEFVDTDALRFFGPS